MQTHFSLAALADPDMARSEKILRACVHCGFCTATCPTFLLTGDELDSPRGRIYLIKEMLENERAADARTTRPYRPLPLLSFLHDDLSVERALHASRRSRPRPYRADFFAPVERAIFARRAGVRSGAARACFALPCGGRRWRGLSPRRCRDGCAASSRWPPSACRRPHWSTGRKCFHHRARARCASLC